MLEWKSMFFQAIVVAIDNVQITEGDESGHVHRQIGMVVAVARNLVNNQTHQKHIHGESFGKGGCHGL
jgi:hypothetical protein